MQNTSVFTDYLTTLTRYALRVDTGRATPEEFTELQEIQPRIIKAYRAGYYERREYTALNSIYYHVLEEFKALLHITRRKEHV